MEYSHSFPWQIISRAAGLALSVKLDQPIDIEKLRSDAFTVTKAFAPQTASNVHHNGGWKAFGLMTVGGNMAEDRALLEQPSPGGGPRTWRDASPTPALEQAPYISELLQRLGSRIGRVRILRLDPGERVVWHYDPPQSIDRFWLRIHLPICTNPGVRLQIGHEDHFWQPGEMWYGEFSYPHRLRNLGSEPRLHLVCDVVIDEQSKHLLPDWYYAQREERERWRPLIQALCKAHQLATFRTQRTYALRPKSWGRREQAPPT
jgi:hypothetical protein